MNNIFRVAEMLGLVLGEKFHVRYNESNISNKAFTLTEDGLSIVDGVYYPSDVLEKLITGKFEVCKTPWKPKRGESYNIIQSSGSIKSEVWLDTTEDFNFYKTGNCFKTSQTISAREYAKQARFYSNEDQIL